MKGIRYLLITTIFTLIGMSNIYAIDKVACGNVSGIPSKIPEITSRMVTILQVAVPVVLIIFGALDFVKGITSGKDDEIAGKRKTFVKRLITGAIVFFVIVGVKLLISVVSDNVSSSNISSCIDCFINNTCFESTIDANNSKKVTGGTAGNAKQQSNLAEKAANNKSSKQKGSTIANNGNWVGVEEGKSIDLPSSAKLSGASYSSSDTSIATVDINGKVTGVKRGQTEIQVTNGTQTKKVNARVVAPIKSSNNYNAPDCYDIHESQNLSSDWWTTSSTPYLILRLGITQTPGLADCRIDNGFDTFVKAARANNIEIGAYYFTKAKNAQNAEAEANFVLDVLKKYDNGTFSLPIYIDYEDQTQAGEPALPRGQAAADIINKFCDVIEGGGFYCGIYASEKVGIYGAGLKFSSTVKSFWVANYVSKPTINDMDIWQYSGSVIDKNHFYKNLSVEIINNGYNNFK